MNTLIYGLQVTLIGMAVVFVGLIVLVFLFKMMSLIVKRILGIGRQEQPDPVPASIGVPSAPVAVAAQEDDGEIAAVIAAAISMMAPEQRNGLVVRSIRRIGVTAPTWNAVGRIDLINTRN